MQRVSFEQVSPAFAQGEPFLPGPTFANPYHLAGDPSSSPYSYGRYHNPTWTHFEQALSELEGGTAVIFASGMAAVTAIFGSVLRPGNVLVMPSDGYYTARMLAEGYFASLGIQVRLAPTAGNAQKEHLDGATLLWLETPSNPGLDVCDLAVLIAAAHQQGTLVAVDNTTATVLGQQPLAYGADFSVSSDSKALTGHGDLLLGHVATREPEWAETAACLSEPAGSSTRSDGSLAGSSLSRHAGYAPATSEPERPGNCPYASVSTGGEACSLSWPSARPCLFSCRSTNEALRPHRQLCA